MPFITKKIGKQGRWTQALILFIMPLFLVFLLRWIFIEPFVIPSESMTPNLLVHDHILVAKYSYGIKAPFGEGWWYLYKKPERGDIVVFRFPQNRDIFYVKRLIGLPGDKITVQNGQIILNDKPWSLRPATDDKFNDIEDFNYFIEKIPTEQAGIFSEHLIKLFSSQDHVDPTETEFTVPENSYFVMGDNRDQSHDSRFWGFVDEKYLVGPAASIWLSCEETMVAAPMICDPLRLRPERMFKKITN